MLLMWSIHGAASWTKELGLASERTPARRSKDWTGLAAVALTSGSTRAQLFIQQAPNHLRGTNTNRFISSLLQQEAALTRSGRSTIEEEDFDGHSEGSLTPQAC